MEWAAGVGGRAADSTAARKKGGASPQVGPHGLLPGTLRKKRGAARNSPDGLPLRARNTQPAAARKRMGPAQRVPNSVQERNRSERLGARRGHESGTPEHLLSFFSEPLCGVVRSRCEKATGKLCYATHSFLGRLFGSLWERRLLGPAEAQQGGPASRQTVRLRGASACPSCVRPLERSAPGRPDFQYDRFCATNQIDRRIIYFDRNFKNVYTTVYPYKVYDS